MKMWSAHHFRVGVGNLTFLFIYFIHHTCFQSAETQHSWVFPLLQCHYKTMFIVCGICSNFTALAPFSTHCLVLHWTDYGIWGTLFMLFYLRMLLLALAQATVSPWVFFPSDRTTHMSSIIWPLSAWQVTSAFPPGCTVFVFVCVCVCMCCEPVLGQ